MTRVGTWTALHSHRPGARPLSTPSPAEPRSTCSSSGAASSEPALRWTPPRAGSGRRVEQRDWAAGTSSRSSKLIHGGLRYLEQLDFALVREALEERGLLRRLLPHLVRPVPFLYPLQHRRLGARRTPAPASRSTTRSACRRGAARACRVTGT